MHTYLCWPPKKVFQTKIAITHSTKLILVCSDVFILLKGLVCSDVFFVKKIIFIYSVLIAQIYLWFEFDV